MFVILSEVRRKPNESKDPTPKRSDTTAKGHSPCAGALFAPSRLKLFLDWLTDWRASCTGPGYVFSAATPADESREAQAGSRCQSPAKAETTDYWRLRHHAFDSQPRHRLP